MVFKLNVPYSSIAEQVGYMKLSRIDLLCGFLWHTPIFPCRICGKESCDGDSEECKDQGAYTLGVSCID